MHQILLGALDHDIVREGGGGSGTPYKLLTLWSKILKVESGAVSRELFQL